MSGLDDLAARVTALESRLEMEAGLRASQDRDLADMAASLRAQTILMPAISATLTDHGVLLRDHTTRLDRMERAMLGLRAGISDLTQMIQTLIDRD